MLKVHKKYDQITVLYFNFIMHHENVLNSFQKWDALLTQSFTGCFYFLSLQISVVKLQNHHTLKYKLSLAFSDFCCFTKT